MQALTCPDDAGTNFIEPLGNKPVFQEPGPNPVPRVFSGLIVRCNFFELPLLHKIVGQVLTCPDTIGTNFIELLRNKPVLQEPGPYPVLRTQV